MKWEFGSDVRTQDWIGCDLNDPANLQHCVDRLEQDLVSAYFARWEVVVREEQGLHPVALICDELGPCDPNEIRRPRPTQPWFQIVRQIVPRMLFEPFDPENPQQREIAARWPPLAATIEEEGYGLSLPDGVTGPLDVVPEELRQRLWQQFAQISPPAPLPAVEGCEVVPLERILPFIAHADLIVRDVAAWYASRFHEDRAEVTDQVLAAMEQYGSTGAFRRGMFQTWLTFDERQFSRLIEIVARDCADPAGDTIAMGVLLDGMAPELLARHREAVLALPWDSLSRPRLTARIEYQQAEPDELWDAFVAEMQRFEKFDDPDFSPFQQTMLGSITDHLLQDPRLEQWVMEVLDRPPTADDYSSIGETTAIYLAGSLRLEPSLPLLIQRMHRDRGVNHGDLEIALAEIRTDSVVSSTPSSWRWRAN